MKSPIRPSLYIMTRGQVLKLLYPYVDNLISTSTNQRMIEISRRPWQPKFEMTDLELMTYFLDMQVKQSPGQIFIL